MNEKYYKLKLSENQIYKIKTQSWNTLNEINRALDDGCGKFAELPCRSIHKLYEFFENIDFILEDIAIDQEISNHHTKIIINFFRKLGNMQIHVKGGIKKLIEKLINIKEE